MRSDVAALPIDLYRVAVGILSSVYFVRLLREFSDFTANSGLLDHELCQRVLWFSRLNIWQAGVSDSLIGFTLWLGLAASLALTAGWRPRAAALTAWIVAVTHFRWNMLVANLDDSAMHLLLFWCTLLPTGHTLVGRQWKEEWRGLRLNGLTTRLFYANLFLYYLVTGLTKYGSELWRGGCALYIAVQLPISHTSGFWSPADLSYLAPLNYATMVIEPLLPFLVLLPRNHPVKWVGGAVWFGLHTGIASLLGIPYANIGQILALILVFQGEIGDRLRQGAPAHRETDFAENSAGKVATAYLIAFALAMSKGVPGLGQTYRAAFAVEWTMGMAQEYHLFDWIDRLNLHMRDVVALEDGTPLPEPLFPVGVRSYLIEGYIYGLNWMPLARGLQGELQIATIQRALDRYARRHPELAGKRLIWQMAVQRMSIDNLALDQPRLRPIAIATLEQNKANVEKLY